MRQTVATATPGSDQVYIDLDDEQRALRDELRTYYTALLTPELRRQMEHDVDIGDQRREVGVP